MRMMKPEIIEDYIEKVYGYAVNHTYTRDEADELSQEILLTVIRELPKLRDDSKFEPWLWGIANNVAKTFRRSMGKNRATYSYDVLENVPYEESDGNETEEIHDFLRTKIAMLSEICLDNAILNLSNKSALFGSSEKSFNFSKFSFLARIISLIYHLFYSPFFFS